MFYAAGASRRGRGTLPPSLDVSRRRVFDRRSTPLARHLPGDQPPAFVGEPVSRSGGAALRTTTEFSRPFYWATWVLIWCLPPVVLARGIRQKDRFVIAVGAIVAILTLVTNKPYLGWPRHTWDPMLLGVLLIWCRGPSSDAGSPVGRAEFATALPPRAYREKTNTG